MSKSARKLIKEPTKVRVGNVHQISADEAVISYLNADHEHVDDLYNVKEPTVMAVLLSHLSGKVVDATLEPDTDGDGHPECSAATIVEA